MSDGQTPLVRKDLDAYYYGFEATGCAPVDLILGAVAQAGKSHHATEDWNEPMAGSTLCAADNIQLAAHLAAKSVEARTTVTQDTEVLLRDMLFWLRRGDLSSAKAEYYAQRTERALREMDELKETAN